MEAVCDAARTIAAGEADVCLAGGSESMTRAPFVLGRSADPFPRTMDLADTRLGWRLVSPRMKEMYPPITLGETAENVAVKYGITRERQDEWALRSHQLAAAARDAGRFDAETVAGHHLTRRGQPRRGNQRTSHARGPGREGPGLPQGRHGHRRQLLAAERRRRRAAAHVGGRGTPGRADAAGPLRGRRGGRRAPGLHGDRAGAAMNRALGRAGWQLDELDLIEVNEAFAAQSVAVVDDSRPTRTGSTSTAARSPSGIRSAAPARGS